MSTRVLIGVAVGLLAAALLLRDLGGGAPAPLLPPRPRAARAVRSGTPPPAAMTRNVFEFGPRPAPEATARPAQQAPPLAPLLSAPPEPTVRLVGLVRRAGVIKAVLKVRGETVEVAVGEAAGDYRVVGIDDDGVRLQAADGTVLTLAAGAP